MVVGKSCRRRGSRKKIPPHTMIPMSSGTTKIASPARTCVAIAPPRYPVRRMAPRTRVAGTK